MPFKYSCFLSYRRGKKRLATKIISDVYDAISSEVEVMIGKEVFKDDESLEGGELFNEAIASDLCGSVCMIVIFTPTYFDKEETFCAREYKAMLRLEEERLQNVGGDLKRKGLIITIVFRGEKYLPDEIRKRRVYHDFSNFLTSDVEISKHPGYAAEIKKIAEYIKERYDDLRRAGVNPTGCDNFALPPVNEITTWLDEISGPPATFVLRETN